MLDDCAPKQRRVVRTGISRVATPKRFAGGKSYNAHAAVATAAPRDLPIRTDEFF